MKIKVTPFKRPLYIHIYNDKKTLLVYGFSCRICWLMVADPVACLMRSKQ